MCSFQKWRSITRSPARPNVPSESSTSLDNRLSWARRMQSGLWLYSNTPSRLRNQLSSAKMNSAQSGRVWRFAPGGFSVERTDHTGATQLLLSIPPPVETGSYSLRSVRREQACNGFHIVAAGEHIGCECVVARSKMILQQSFEHGAHVDGRLEVAVVQQVRRLQPGPVGDYATAFERAAGDQHDRGGPVVGAVRTVDARRAAELGDEHHHGLAPRRSHVFLDSGESPIERAQQLRQPASCDAFIIMCVPAVERERADARTVGLRQELCGGANGLGEIGTQLSEVGRQSGQAASAPCCRREQLPRAWCGLQ